MPHSPDDFRTGGALQGAVAASLVRHREAAAELAPGMQLGIYRVVRELGRGGMAIVYLAERDDGEYRQQVALKWMQSAPTMADAEALFRRERQALADLRHPHIARLLDGGRSEQGRPWLVMELIEGEPLDRHCARHGAPLAQRLGLFLQVCSAVSFAHARGVLHRDIKPSNVLVDADGSARLLDFGIAQLLGQEDELAARAFTPGSASPEQVRGDVLTVASDVYQLGRLLQRILQPERDATTDAAQATVMPTEPAVDSAAAPAPAVVMPTALPRDLGAILARATSPEPGSRYATVDALASDLRAFTEHRPVSARPRTAGYVATRYIRRHPAAVTILSAAFALLLAMTLYFTDRIRSERDVANYQATLATSVLDFLQQDLLAAADPGAAPGRELTVREALDLASNAADARFRDSPAEHSMIRATLAGLYDQLGRYADAEREARKAVSLAQATGIRPATLRNAQLTLVDTLISRGEYEQASIELDQLDADIAGSSLADSHEALWIEQRRVVLHNRRGEHAAALEASQALLQRIRKAVGPDDPLVLSVLVEVATNLQMLGRQEEALGYELEILDRRRSQLGPSHPSTLMAAHNLGVLKRHQGHAQEALVLLAETLAQRRRVLGARHPETLASMNEYATVLQELQRYDEAGALFREVLDARVEVLGEEHLFTRNSMSNLGLLYSLSGQLELAAPLYERALAIERRVVGETLPDTIALMHNIAGLYRKQQRLPEALAMHARAIAAAGSSPDLGPQAWQTGLFRAGHALSLEAAGELDAAATEIGAAIAILGASLGPEHPRTVRAREMQAQIERQRPPAPPH